MSDKKRKSTGKEEVVDNAKRSKKSPENGNAVATASASSKPLLSGKEHEDLKRFLRERKKFLTQRPNLELTAVGRAASIERLGSTSSVAIMASDVRLLLLYLMMGDKMQDHGIGCVVLV